MALYKGGISRFIIFNVFTRKFYCCVFILYFYILYGICAYFLYNMQMMFINF